MFLSDFDFHANTSLAKCRGGWETLSNLVESSKGSSFLTSYSYGKHERLDCQAREEMLSLKLDDRTFLFSGGGSHDTLLLSRGSKLLARSRLSNSCNLATLHGKGDAGSVC